MINGENFFYQPVKDIKVTYENIRKIATGQEDDYTTGCLLNYPYFRDSYKMISIDLSKQQVLNGEFNKLILQQILDRAGNKRTYFNLQEANEAILDFSQGTIEVLKICYIIIFSLIKNDSIQ